ncbi:Hsp70 family protein [Flaviaesturariibacter amylovorans]|uniref:Hsp70 family protein n=1 Tax=Flaviaesturariibacter amylovorans TaxID=1084520 RepID=A0ABP8HP62_9BACT
MHFINFGIDLGTTNSLIARFEGGSVQVFKNPRAHRETLPSVVAFRGDRTLVGDKAQELIAKDPANVIGSFKRKMGTDESYFVPATVSFVTPIELSAAVLKELKSFVHTGEAVERAVITIPASFDTIQSNATKKAGYAAGFTEVVLLQEPIAAALAYFNESKRELPESGNWLVYDLGGGTFDVALVSIVNGELRVVDHEGNNFLGGIDFDHLLIEELIVPELVRLTGNAAIGEELRNRDGALEKLFYILLYKAEAAKKELSTADSTEIEFNIPGQEEEVVLTLRRADLERLLHDRIAGTTDLIAAILKRNALAPAQVERIILVGGSTYIPYVRRLVAERTGITPAFDADPTTAIAVGAAYYAGSRLAAAGSATATAPDVATPSAEAPEGAKARRIKSVFPTVSSEEEELFMAMPEEGDFSGLSYRITRNDGGFDSGLRPVGTRISEFLPLQKGAPNSFTLTFTDASGNTVPVAHGPIEIMQGKFNVAGQPLPNDICLEVDDIENNRTKLQVLFERNALLPLKKTIYKEITRTIPKGSPEVLVINVLEGTRHSRPHSNLVIGVIEIKGADLKSDLVKGSDVEIRVEMNESRDLSISAFLAMSEQEFKNVFSTSEKQVSLARLHEDLHALLREMKLELRDERERDDESAWTSELRQCIRDAERLQARLQKLSEKDLTDAKWEISEERRRISVRYDALGSEQRLANLQEEYLGHKHFIEEQLPFVDLDQDKLLAEFDRITQDERHFLRAQSPAILRAKIEALDSLRRKLLSNTKHWITRIFLQLSNLPPDAYTKPAAAKALIRQGEEALEREHFEGLRSAAIQLSHLVHGASDELDAVKIKGTGIG